MRCVPFCVCTWDHELADTWQAKIEEYEGQLSELQDQNRELQECNNSLNEELTKLRQENEAQATEVASLRSRSNLSQQNWIKERDELISREAYAREEFENAKQAMQDWEVLAMNERSLRESLSEKEGELKEQLENLKEEFERAVRDRDQNNQAVEGLQKALQEVQNRKYAHGFAAVHAYPHQCEDLNSRNPWRPMNHRLMSYENRSNPRKKPRKQPRTWSSLQRKNQREQI